MCRIQGEGKWNNCGSSSILTATVAGCVELEVNDQPQNNNSGAYDVYLEVLP